ncbi:MAG: hypothetical protein JJU02_12575 [Cryomorphaceae bacterium]|nr:hypothetical protein [Cryomorphaceae bacterium]
MSIDLKKGISLKIEGELGKHQTLSIDKLIEISKSLQELVFSVIRNELEVEKGINLDNFKLELSDFSGGSAIPTFVLPHHKQQSIHPVETQTKDLETKLEEAFQIMHSGNYGQLKEKYPDFIRRNEMVNSIYNLSNSFNNSPVYIGEYDRETNKFKENFKAKKFRTSVKNSLIIKVDNENSTSEESAFAEIKLITRGNKATRKQITSIISKDNHSLSYSPNEIQINNRHYIFNFPLRCLYKFEDNVHFIQNEMLDLIGTGDNENDAENSFKEEFDYLYNRLQDLEKNQLTKRMNKIKAAFEFIIKSVD